jgi:hypothetical protein
VELGLGAEVTWLALVRLLDPELEELLRLAQRQVRVQEEQVPGLAELGR